MKRRHSQPRDCYVAIKHAIRTLRCTLPKMFLNEDYRGRCLAECPSFQCFCNLDELGAVRVRGKSTLNRYAHWLPGEEMQVLTGALIKIAARTPGGGLHPLG